MVEKKEEPYNRIVLIGNGFDKALGLETSYLNFILDYLRNAVLDVVKNGNYDSELISLKLLNSNFLLDPALIKKINDSEAVNELLEIIIKSEVRISYKFSFFEKIVKEIADVRWVDIEKYYFNNLIQLYREYERGDIKRKKGIIGAVISLNKCMKLIADALNSFISEQQDTNPTDYLNSPFKALFDKFQAPLMPKQANLVIRHSRKEAPYQIIFLNFNYTNSVLGFLDHAFINKKYAHIHIHGKVDDSINPLIFGYGDDTGDIYKSLELTSENDFLRMIKSFCYPRTNNYHRFLNFLEDKEYDVLVVGHSCGVTDKTLLKTIFEHEHCLAIQNFHYKGEDEDFDKRMEISRHFSDKPRMRERLLKYDKLAIIPQAQQGGNKN